MRRFYPLFVMLFAAACARSGTTAGASPAPALAYGVPAAGVLTYVIADTGGFVMEIPGMGPAPVDIQSRVTADLAFAPAGDSLRVTATVTTFDGRFASPAGPPVSAGDAQKPGPAVLHVAPDGDVRLVDVPPFEGALAQITSPAALYNAFFVRLPGRVAAVGATWTDTLRIDEELSGMRSVMTQVIRSTWARDTVVAGATLALITSDIRTELSIEGVSQGVEIRQSLSGTSSAWALWDPAGRFLVERSEQGETSGTADLPGLGMVDIPVTARSRQVVRRSTR